jgi:hypothetical protein
MTRETCLAREGWGAIEKRRAFGYSFYWPQMNTDEIDWLHKNPKFAYQQTGFIKIRVDLHFCG